MAYASDRRSGKSFGTRSLKLDFVPEDGDWREDPEPTRDLKKYILVFGLGALSWVATYIGMLELIQANLGALPFTHKVVIGFSVAMLMVMIIWLLDQMFKPHAGVVKLAYVAGYLFLTLISVGFGFGFYWKVLESRTEASRSAESAVGQVQSSLNGASTRLEQLQATLTQLADVSEKKSELERTKGTSCPNSRPGDGPRRKMRAADAAKFAFASEFVAGRVGAIKQDMKALDGDLIKIAKKDQSIVDPKSGTRNAFMRSLGRKLDLTVTGFNAFRTDPQLKQLRGDLAERASKTVFTAEGGKTFSCPDAQLQQALRGAVRALDQLPVLDKPKIAVVEGSEATIEAFRRLTATLQGALTFQLPPSADELRALQQKAIRQAVSSSDREKLMNTETAGLSTRDYVPLAIALFVDLCLLLVSMGRATNRIENLVPKMRAAERGPVIEILSRFKDIHRDPQVRDNFEVFRHVVFDQNGDYYVAVPLDAPFRGNPRGVPGESYGSEQAQELQHEAHLLANLFTSFEKERIFRRVYNPVLLNTRAIQKRLARQGSKFAACEAFRVYKFRDGAWSEIILGAVMGAARRAETKRRIAELEQTGLERMSASSFDLPEGPLSMAPQPSHSEHGDNAGAPGNGAGVPRSERTDTAAYQFATDPLSYPLNNRDRLNPNAGSDGLRSRLDAVRRQHRAAHARADVTAEDQAKFGPYAMHVSTAPSDLTEDWGDVHPHLNEAEVTVSGRDGSSVDDAEQSAAHPVQVSNASLDAEGDVHSKFDTDSQLTVAGAELPPAVPTQDARFVAPTTVNGTLTDEGRVDVVLTRDTATVSIPATEATLPKGVAGLMRKALQAADAELNGPQAQINSDVVDAIDEDGAEAQQELPIALPDYHDDNEIDAEYQSVDAHGGDELSQLASRFAARTDG